MTDTLTEAKNRFKFASDAWRDINQKAKEDLRFLSDEPYAQWDQVEATRRATVNRPVVQIDQLTQYVHQVSNDIRMNTPTIQVIPTADGDVEQAEMIQGRIKAIEYKSNADAAYDMAADFAIKSSLGYIRVDHGYVSDKGFEQELRIKRVINPQSILIDPNSIESDGSDARYGFVLEEITVAEFNKKYPDAAPVSFSEENQPNTPKESDTITIAEYFYIEDGEEEIGLLDDGKYEQASKKKKYKSTRKVKKPTVYRCWVSGEDLLTEPSRFPGKYIPLVPVYGEEAWIDGRRHLLSLIRKAKSPAMMYNNLKSSELEILMKQLQSPVMAAVGQMRGFEQDWKEPDKAMVLYYHQTDVSQQPAPPPQRLIPPTVSQGYAAASIDAESNIKKSLGMYSAAVGNREGDSSGKALMQLEQSSDLATLHFADNLTRSITQVGKIIVCALPEIEDTARVVTTISKEEEMKPVGINGARVEGQERDFTYTGEEDVRVITGPSATTQRQGASQFYQDVIKILPPEIAVNMMDLVFKYNDAPGAQAAASRMKKMVDPKLLDESERGKDAPDPQIQVIQQEATQVIEAAKAEIEAMQEELQKTQQELQAAKVDNANKMADTQIKGAELPLKEQELKLKEQENQIKLIELEQKMALEREKMQHDMTKTRIAAKQQVMTPDVAMMDGDFHDGEPPIAMVLGQITQAMTMQSQELSQGLQMIAATAQESAERQAQATGALVAALNKPKRVVLDSEGNPIGIQ